MRPMFTDPRTDVVFKRLFGSEQHKDLLIALLNGLLELDEAHRITEVELLSPEQRPEVAQLKLSIVDVRCRDIQGVQYIVEMQVLNVEGFEKRVVYNVAKAYVHQLDAGQPYPRLNDVIGITICDFELFPSDPAGQTVPLLSRWRMTEQHHGAVGLGQLQFVFLELPKLVTDRAPQSIVEKWAYFFRETGALQAVPDALSGAPFSSALAAARAAGFSAEEWEVYLRAQMALQDERGALVVAQREGRAEGWREGQRQGLEEGRKEGQREGLEEGRREGLKVGLKEGQLAALRAAVLGVLGARGLPIDAAERERVGSSVDVATLERWLAAAAVAGSTEDALR